MSDQANTGLREEVRSRYAEAAPGMHSAIIRAVKTVR